MPRSWPSWSGGVRWPHEDTGVQDAAFPGLIGTTYRDSRPWLEPVVRPPEGAPNVVLVVLDDVGFAQLGCYGSNIDTPHMDALAAGGRRYNNFHTTAMCSSTRATLLTGRNHHAVGMGMIADWCTGYPGYQGQVTKRAATLAEMLRPLGYGTFAIGKWHLTRARDMTAAGPFDQWPLGRGFERYYGFLVSLMDQWNPELIADNHAIPTPRRPGYHLSEDLVDQAIGMIRDQQAASPGRPFFTYLAFGACHSPHQAPREYIDKYRGRFDGGWDAMREAWFAKQLELGIVPAGTRLSSLDGEVRPWATLTDDERRLCARHQEVFAGFLDHTDAQIGRLAEYLGACGQMENTLFIVLSDNGATAEGEEFGDINIRRHYQFLQEPFEQKLAEIDRLGSEFLWNNYPRGWGHAGNTPLKRFKMHTHGGGIRDPLIVHWPARIGQGGLVSPQFCHCADIVPTVLEAVGIEAPRVLQGIEQLPIDGTSLCYTFDEPLAPAQARVQYFELMGNRGLWADGWKAVTRHAKGADYDTERWELYHVDSDFSETEDLAESCPGKLRELVDLWWQEARRNHVLPLDDRDRERTLLTYWDRPRSRWSYAQGMTRVSGYAAPSVANRSYTIVADVELELDTAGVILAVGGKAGGYVLFVQDGRLVHEYLGPDRRWVVESTDRLPAGRHELSFRFRKTDHCAGTATLSCDGATIGGGAMSGMWPMGPTSGGVFCGYDDGSPVSERYQAPFAFTGRIHGVTVEAGADFVANRELANHAALSED
jgi:arylsulfatase A-like enzyme